MLREGEWAGEAELLAAARSYGVCITCCAVTPVPQHTQHTQLVKVNTCTSCQHPSPTVTPP
jgi:hypothetical protein